MKWIEPETFKKWKQTLLTSMIGLPEDIFIVLDEKPDVTTTQIYNVVSNGYNIRP